MEVTLHIGMPKSGTKFFQYTCYFNKKAIEGNGVYYAHDERMPSAHKTGWECLLGFYDTLGVHFQQAHQAGCNRMLISCEDLCSVIVRRGVAHGIVEALRVLGAQRISLVIHFRDVADYFFSLYSQLSANMYIDPYFFFHEAMRLGLYSVRNDGSGNYGPYYEWIFDYPKWTEPFIQDLSGIGGVSVAIRDYHAERDRPGFSILRDLGVEGLVQQFPAEWARNTRRQLVEVTRDYRLRFEAVAGSAAEQLGQHVEERTTLSNGERDAMLEALRDRFQKGNRAFVDRHRNSMSPAT